MRLMKILANYFKLRQLRLLITDRCLHGTFGVTQPVISTPIIIVCHAHNVQLAAARARAPSGLPCFLPNSRPRRYAKENSLHSC